MTSPSLNRSGKTYETNYSDTQAVDKKVTQFLKDSSIESRIRAWPTDLNSLENVQQVVGLFLQSIDAKAELFFCAEKNLTRSYVICTSNPFLLEIGHLVKISLNKFHEKKTIHQYDLSISANGFKKSADGRFTYLIMLTTLAHKLPQTEPFEEELGGDSVILDKNQVENDMKLESRKLNRTAYLSTEKLIWRILFPPAPK